MFSACQYDIRITLVRSAMIYELVRQVSSHDYYVLYDVADAYEQSLVLDSL